MKQNNGITEMVFILDRSGSMAGLESDTIGGFNSMIEKQKKEEGSAFVTTVLFDNETEYLHDRVPLEKIEKLTDKDYFVRGCTALLDAVGESIERTELIHKHLRSEDVPSNVIYVITTDGMENASRKFDYDKVKKLIESKKECGWEFLFIGANIDAAKEASKIGISRERSANYVCDEVGTGVLFNAISNAVSCARTFAGVKNDWSASLEADVKRRKK